MIHIQNVSFQYGQEETGGVRDISIHIPKRSCTVLCGPSGCGKTTLLRLVSGLAPTVYPGEFTGLITVCGKNPAALSSHEKAAMMGMVFQDPRSQFFMSNVRDEIAFTGENLGLDPKEILAKTDQMAELLGLQNLMERRLDSLSSGQKQRVAVAAACLLNPPLLILDEPTANLDQSGAAVLMDILYDLKSRGTAILISEHRLHEFLPVADSFICINEGRMTAQWSRNEFMALNADIAGRLGLRHPEIAATVNMKDNAHDGLPAFQVKNLSYCYEKDSMILEDLNFSIAAGCATAIIGENGSGKTTLGKILCGLTRQTGGQILCDKKKLSPKRRCAKSYFVMQDADYQLYTESVGNELVLGRKITEELRQKAYAAMELFGLTHLKDRHPASLSGGEKQRVTLSAAYCSDARMIILDEPTSGLDAMNAKRVAQFIRFLTSEGKAVVVITHDDFLVRLACDQMITIKS